MCPPAERQCCAAIRDIPVVRILGPRALVDGWLDDPDLRLTVPGFRVLDEPPPRSPLYAVRFEPGGRRCLVRLQEDGLWTIEGDLDSFARHDFRRLLVHLAKVAVMRAGHALVHAACVVSPSGRTVLLCGAQQSGKSTLAIALACAGYKVISTDVTLLNADVLVLAGTRHVNLFPAVIRDYFPQFTDLIPSQAGGVDGFERKIAVPTPRIEAMGLFGDAGCFAAVSHVFHLAIRRRESLPYCQPMDDQEKLQHSVVVSEDWAISTWLSPSWLVFFPTVLDGQAEEQGRRLAVRLAGRPHYRVGGEVDFAVACVQTVVQ